MPPYAIAAILVASVSTLPSNVLPVLAGLLADAHGLDAAQIGYLASANTSAGLVTSATAPYWITRVNPRYAASAFLALNVCGITGLSLAPSLTWLFVSQIVIGTAAVGVSAICLTVLTQLPNPARAIGFRITVDVILAGTFLALAPVALLGLGGFVAVIAVMFVIAIGTAAPRLPQRAIERAPSHIEVKSLRSAPLSAWLVLAALTAFHTGGSGVWVFLAKIGDHAGFSRDVTSNVVAAGLFAGIVGSLGAAAFAGRTPRVWLPVFGGAAFLVSLPAMVLARDLATFTAAVFAFNAGWNFYTPFLMSLIALRDPTKRMGSLIPAATMIGSIVGSISMGVLLRSSGAELATFTMTGASMTSIVAFILLARKRAPR